MQKTGGGLGRESPFSAYHLYGKPVISVRIRKEQFIPVEIFRKNGSTSGTMWPTSARLTRESENSAVFFKCLVKAGYGLLVKVKKYHCKNRVRSILLSVGSKKIVISQNRSN